MNTKAMSREQLLSEIQFRKSILTEDASAEFLKEIEILEYALAQKPETFSILKMWERQHEARIQAIANKKGISFDEAQTLLSERIAKNRNR